MITCTVCRWTGCEHQLSFNCCPKCDSEVEIPSEQKELPKGKVSDGTLFGMGALEWTKRYLRNLEGK